MAAQHDVNAEWMRLQELLTEMRPGDTVSVDTLVAESGLPLAVVTSVLTELQRVELFTRQDERVFVRRSLWQEQTG